MWKGMKKKERNIAINFCLASIQAFFRDRHTARRPSVARLLFPVFPLGHKNILGLNKQRRGMNKFCIATWS